MSIPAAVAGAALLMASLAAPPLAAQQTGPAAPVAASPVLEPAAPAPPPAGGPRAPAPFPIYEPEIARDGERATAAMQDRTTISISTVALVAIIVLLVLLLVD